MKNIILLLTILMTFSSLATEKFENIYFWKNNNKKIFNYYVQPELNISIEKLDAGVDDYYAIISVKTTYSNINQASLNRLAGDLEKKRIAVNQMDQVMELQFSELNETFEINILNMPNGPGIEETFFVDKKTYYRIQKNPKFEASYKILATPLISQLIESKKLARDTCRNLFKNGSSLEKVSGEFLKVLNSIEKLQFKTQETKFKLIQDVKNKCFEEFEIRAYSFSELMSSEVTQNSLNPQIEVSTFKDEYSQKTLELSFEGEL